MNLSIAKSKYGLHMTKVRATIKTLGTRLGVNVQDRVCRLAILNRAAEICGCEQHDVIEGSHKVKESGVAIVAVTMVVLLWAAWATSLGAGISCAGVTSRVAAGK